MFWVSPHERKGGKKMVWKKESGHHFVMFHLHVCVCAGAFGCAQALESVCERETMCVCMCEGDYVCVRV